MGRFIDIGTIRITETPDKNGVKRKRVYIKLEKGLKMKITGKTYRNEVVEADVVEGGFINVLSREDKHKILAKGDQSTFDEIEERVKPDIAYYLSVTND